MEESNLWKLYFSHLKSYVKLVEYYETNNMLSKELREVLKIDLMYPHWFFSLIKSMFKSDEVIISDRIYSLAKFEQNKYIAVQKWL